MLQTTVMPAAAKAGLEDHVLEQHANNRLIRPRAEYTGPTQAAYVPLDSVGDAAGPV